MYQEGTDHLIWSNYDLNLEDWRDSLEELYPHYSEDELYEKMYDSNAANLDDERCNLNIQLSSPILVTVPMTICLPCGAVVISPVKKKIL